MRIEIDTETCTGHGRCFSLAPELFDSDDDGHGVVKVEQVPEGLEDSARLAASSCPEFAVKLFE